MFCFDERALRLYAEALMLYKKSEYKAALAILEKIERFGIMPFKALLLRAYIFRATGAAVSEVNLLTDMLKAAKPKNSSDKDLVAEAWSLLGAAYSGLGDNEKAREAFIKSAEFSSDIRQKLTELSNAIFASNHITGLQIADMKQLYRQYNDLLSDICQYREYIYHDGAIRLGFLSADFHTHPVALLVEALFHYHDNGKIKLYCYSATADEDRITERLRSEADVWIDVCGLSFKEIAARIHSDAIDVLFDLSGHTANTLLPVVAYKAAPVQISGIGYMGSTGLHGVDYFFSDRYLDESENDDWFSEKLIRMSTTHFCFSPLSEFPLCGELPFLRNGYITFGCFNNLAKLTDEMMVAWQIIMSSVPQSRLVLKHKLVGSCEGRQYIEKRLSNIGINLSRVELRDFSADYLADYNDIDIALDTYPYTGGLTTIESLLMGVPIVSLYGERHGSRFGRSILCNAGIGELAVPSIEVYISTAISLANDIELLKLLHQNLRGLVKNSPLMDGRSWANEFEDLIFRIVDRCRR